MRRNGGAFPYAGNLVQNLSRCLIGSGLLRVVGACAEDAAGFPYNALVEFSSCLCLGADVWHFSVSFRKKNHLDGARCAFSSLLACLASSARPSAMLLAPQLPVMMPFGEKVLVFLGQPIFGT